MPCCLIGDFRWRRVALRLADRLGVAEMALSEIGRVAAIVEKACTAVIDNPADIAARRSLFSVLAPIVNPIFVDHNDLPPYLHGMMRQACTLGEILQARIDVSRRQTGRESIAAESIRAGARDLRRVLRGVIDGLSAGKNA
jgi:hypothetical protein